MRRIGVVLALIGCGGKDEDTGAYVPPTNDGACGAVTYDNPAVVTGRILLPDGAPAAGATVIIEERNWTPGTVHAEGVTAADGTYELDAALTIVEGCWGTAVAYYLVADLGEQHGEHPLNSFLFNAIDPEAMDPDGVAEITDVSLDE